VCCFVGGGSEYLFACAVSSEPVSSSVYAERHLVTPLRDERGVAALLLDMNLGQMDDAPSPAERRQLGHMMGLLTAASAEVVANSRDGKTVSCIGKSQFAQLLGSNSSVMARRTERLKHHHHHHHHHRHFQMA